jgi:hypothetical protein
MKLESLSKLLEQNKASIYHQDDLDIEVHCAEEGYQLIVTKLRYDPRYNKIVMTVRKDNEE